MKRDMDLIRELLLHNQAKFNDGGHGLVAGITAVAVLAFATAMAIVAIL